MSASDITSKVRRPRRAVAILVALAGTTALAIMLSLGTLRSSPASAQSPGAVAKASRGNVVLTVGGVGRIVPAGLSAEISIPASAPTSGSAQGSAGSSGAAPPAATSSTSVFPRASGRLLRFLVAPGDRVAAGQPLALLDDRHSAADAVGQARTEVATAMVELRQKRTSDPLKGIPPTQAELTAAHRAVTSARARLARVLQGAAPADISTARLDVKRAEADLETLQGGTPEARAAAIRVAEQNVQLAQARLDKLLAPPNPADVAAAEADVRRAESDLAVLFKPTAGTVPEEITAAKAAVASARAKLARLTGPPDPADVTAARLEVERAQADLQRLLAGPSPVALAAARQAVATAKTKLAQLLGPPVAADVATARSDVFKAEADLALLGTRGAPASALDIALARLKVVAARLRLGTARAATPLLTVRAPSAGTVTALLTAPGAPVDPLTPVAAVADLQRLEVTVDLSEFDVARVRPGQKAMVSVDALGGKRFRGRVVFAALTGSNASGVVTFPVRVAIADAPGLRPGMNVSVRIIVAKRQNVVQIPLEAVSRNEEDQPIVNVVDAAGQESPRAVKLGLASNKNVEIVKGLRVGDHVALAQAEAQAAGD
jgi:HlyD family secretion protein